MTAATSGGARVAHGIGMLSHRPLKRGVEAGLIASVPQVILAKVEEKLLMPRGDDADLGPRFVDRLADMAGLRLDEDTRWLAASAFHFGYAVFWGLAYGLAHRRWRPHPLVGGTALGALIYAITFPHWGGAVLTGTEHPPQRRSWQKELVLATAAMTFGLGTALLYGRGAADQGPESRPHIG
jgi:hypothetical protein